MKHKVGVVLLLYLSLMSLLVVPVAGATDGDKALVKDMVQSPGDYSVGLTQFDYYTEMFRYEYGGFIDMLRNEMQLWRLYRLVPPDP